MPEVENTITEEVKTEVVSEASRTQEFLSSQKPAFQGLPEMKLPEPVVEEVAVEEKPAETPELNADGTPKVVVEPIVENQTEAKPVEKTAEVDVVVLLNTALNEDGIAISSIEEIKNIIAEHKNFKALESQYKELSQEERARLEVGREFGDFGLYDRVMKIDTKSITAKEALRQVFILDNLDSNPQYLEKKFEKDFTKTYEEEADEDYSKLELENNGRKAIDRLIELQQDLKERGKISGGTDPEAEKKAKEEADNKWFAGVDSAIEKVNKITYELEDETSKEKFAINIVMDAKDKQLIQEAMDNPIGYIKNRITDGKGGHDFEALAEFILRDFYFEKALDEARKSGAAVREESILKNKKQTVIESVKAGDAGNGEVPLREQFAKNLSEYMKR